MDREGPIHRAILDYLRLALPDAVIHHSPNERDMRGPAAIRQIIRARALGTRKGWPDIEVILPGRCLFFEVKSPGCYPTQEQREVGEALRALGHFWAVVRSVDDAEAALRSAGVIA